MTLPSGVEARIRRLALENAVAHGSDPKPEPIVSKLLGTDASLRPVAGEVTAAVQRIVAEVVAIPPSNRQGALAQAGGPEPSRTRPAASEMGEFPELPGAIPGKVVLRLAPFPSGALHLGNARMLFVNDYYRSRYDARLLLVYDDTVGSEGKRIDAELFDVIRRDLELCSIPVNQVVYKSDRIPQFYPWARQLIEKGAAYVCVCPAERLRENRADGRACAERGQSREEAMEGFERMLNGGYAVGEAVLRLKTSMTDPDPAFRDRVLMRLSDLDHPRVGRKYRLWPMLEFSWAVDDVELGVTHVLRGKDLVIEDRMQQFIWNVLGVSGPVFAHWGLLRVREAKISKSKSYQEVKSGEYDGWADPRTWSIQSLDRRGISMEAIRRFTLSFGMSLADIQVPAETLYAENRKLIDGEALRRLVVIDPIRVDVEGYPTDLGTVRLPNHPDRPELGSRAVATGPSFYLSRRDVAGKTNQELRLKDLLNLRISDPVPAEGTRPMAAQFVDRENRKLPRVQWVAAESPTMVNILMPDGTHQSGLGERALLEAKSGDLFQFERVGFVRVDTQFRPDGSTTRVVYAHP